MAEIAKIRYLKNDWSYKVRSPLILSERGIFLLVFHIIYTHQTNRNVTNLCLCLVMDDVQSVQLTKEDKKADLTKCIICKKSKKNEKKLRSTRKGRDSIIDASKRLNDSLLSNISASELDYI